MRSLCSPVSVPEMTLRTSRISTAVSAPSLPSSTSPRIPMIPPPGWPPSDRSVPPLPPAVRLESGSGWRRRHRRHRSPESAELVRHLRLRCRHQRLQLRAPAAPSRISALPSSANPRSTTMSRPSPPPGSSTLLTPRASSSAPAASGEAPPVVGWSDSNLLSSMLDGDQGPFCNSNAQIRSLAAALTNTDPGHSGAEHLYAGMAGVRQRRRPRPRSPLRRQNPRWIHGFHHPMDRSLCLARRQFRTRRRPVQSRRYDISSIFVDPHDPTGQTLYATIQGIFATA